MRTARQPGKSAASSGVRSASRSSVGGVRAAWAGSTMAEILSSRLLAAAPVPAAFRRAKLQELPLAGAPERGTHDGSHWNRSKFRETPGQCRRRSDASGLKYGDRRLVPRFVSTFRAAFRQALSPASRQALGQALRAALRTALLPIAPQPAVVIRSAALDGSQSIADPVERLYRGVRHRAFVQRPVDLLRGPAGKRPAALRRHQPAAFTDMDRETWPPGLRPALRTHVRNVDPDLQNGDYIRECRSRTAHRRTFLGDLM